MNDDGGVQGAQGGLPSLRVSAMLLWRGRPLVALEAGGLFLRGGRGWEEARTGFGALHVRHLLEGAGGELYMGAKEGLFLVQWGGNSIERLHSSPVRSIALGAGMVLAGGEKGLTLLKGGRASAVATPDAWIDWVGARGSQVVLLTAQGLAMGPLDGDIRLIPQDARGAAQLGDSVYIVGEGSMLKLGMDGRFSQEYLPQVPRRVFASGGLLFADTDAGLFKKGPSGWTPARRRPSALPPGSAHVTAMTHFQGQLAVGTFDGGAAVGTWDKDGTSNWRALPTAHAWGINALLPFGGALAVASLRGASRVEGSKIKPLDPPGSAFSLAQTPRGMAVGYGHGVLLPGGEFLSAFHGLPGNQALAMLHDDYLYVGTPSGLGAISGNRVAWRTMGGDGLLPHPWVTSLASFKNALYIGTYGGGVARRTKEGGAARGAFQQFPETDGLKINTGCMAVFDGALLVGTDGKGIYRLNVDAARFEPIRLPIPSNSVTALLPDGDSLLVGTNEGIARLPRPLFALGK
jgi:ligand-binding sensor domain-containing protein